MPSASHGILFVGLISPHKTPHINTSCFLSLTGALYGNRVTFLISGENVD